MKVTTKIAPVKGIGKPDYSRDVSAAIERPGLRLKYNESLKIFGRAFTSLPLPPPPFAWITAPLAADDTASVIDFETGFTLPYTIPKGYTLTMLTRSHSFTQDTISWLYVDGYLYACYGVQAAGSVVYHAQVVEHGTHLIDPTGDTTHLIDLKVTNLGEADLEGSWSIRTILKAVGTQPLPTTKTVKCKFCGNEQTVPLDTSQVICSKCGKLNIYYDLTSFRET